jgi:hypothetical protein
VLRIDLEESDVAVDCAVEQDESRLIRVREAPVQSALDRGAAAYARLRVTRINQDGVVDDIASAASRSFAIKDKYVDRVTKRYCQLPSFG